MPDLHPDDPRHGTYAGYGAGCRCPDCRRANTAYQGAYRKANSDKHRDVVSARRQAHRRLADIYPDLYRALYSEEMAAIKRRRANALHTEELAALRSPDDA